MGLRPGAGMNLPERRTDTYSREKKLPGPGVSFTPEPVPLYFEFSPSSDFWRM